MPPDRFLRVLFPLILGFSLMGMYLATRAVLAGRFDLPPMIFLN